MGYMQRQITGRRAVPQKKVYDTSYLPAQYAARDARNYQTQMDATDAARYSNQMTNWQQGHDLEKSIAERNYQLGVDALGFQKSDAERRAALEAAGIQQNADKIKQDQAQFDKTHDFNVKNATDIAAANDKARKNSERNAKTGQWIAGAGAGLQFLGTPLGKETLGGGGILSLPGKAAKGLYNTWFGETAPEGQGLTGMPLSGENVPEIDPTAPASRFSPYMPEDQSFNMPTVSPSVPSGYEGLEGGGYEGLTGGGYQPGFYQPSEYYDVGAWTPPADYSYYDPSGYYSMPDMGTDQFYTDYDYYTPSPYWDSYATDYYPVDLNMGSSYDDFGGLWAL
jgi:hypothetical protein